ncbi:MAG: FecR domain-containing protein [Porticoccaceae bacterium]
MKVIRSHVRAEAVRQFMALNDPRATPEQIQTVLDWVEQSPQHRDAFEAVTEAWHACDGVGISPRQSPTPRAAVRRWHQSPLSAIGAAAALLLVAVLTIGVLRDHDGDAGSSIGDRDAVRYATETGVPREVALPDGSQVTLGGASKLVVSYGKRHRDIILVDGHAFFDVASDPSRPFVVDTGDGEVRALGTRFDVRKVLGTTVVEVAEGAIRITTRDQQGQTQSMAVKAGTRASYSSDGDLGPALSVDPASVGSWRYGRFNFVDTPLSHIVSELNRYGEHSIVLDDAAVGEMRVTAVIRLDKADEWLRSFAAISDIVVITDASGDLRLNSP